MNSHIPQRAEVFLSTSPGGEKHSMGSLFLNEAGALVGELTVGAEWNAPQYFVVKVGEVPIALKPTSEMDDLKQAAELMLKCELLAAFRAKALINDRAVPAQNDIEFDALPALIDLKYADFREMFSKDAGFENLAAGLPERDAHAGPFEVLVEKTEVFEIVGLLTEKTVNSVWDIGRTTWEKFVSIAANLLEQKKLAEAEVALPLSPAQRGNSVSSTDAPKTWEDWVERFRPKLSNEANAAFDGFLIWERDPIVLDALRETPDCVWTLHDNNGINTCGNGFSRVNSMGCFITEVPYTGEDCEFYYDEDDRNIDPDADDDDEDDAAQQAQAPRG